ncbi:acid-soluble spore protein [Clostridium sp. CT7]|uniref:alpha/beta-type small acid-soluble spore protein n=2 Tax=Clostridium TaxID=1485 RepID=UPI0008261464|nr:alpha/beta-type small acid-soluble spore protein [Clostridium sp. CT7]PJI06744.1 acid-soluble spore protein [Clostridium sp. CT7]
MDGYNKKLLPQTKEKLNRFKLETVNEIGINIKLKYNGELTSKEAGSLGGSVVKKMLQSYEKN